MPKIYRRTILEYKQRESLERIPSVCNRHYQIQGISKIIHSSYSTIIITYSSYSSYSSTKNFPEFSAVFKE